LISAFGPDDGLGSALSDSRCHLAVKINHLAASAANQTVTWSHMVENLRRIAENSPESPTAQRDQTLQWTVERVPHLPEADGNSQLQRFFGTTVEQRWPRPQRVCRLDTNPDRRVDLTTQALPGEFRDEHPWGIM